MNQRSIDLSRGALFPKECKAVSAAPSEPAFGKRLLGNRFSVPWKFFDGSESWAVPRR